MGDLVTSIIGVNLTPLRRIATPGGDVLHALKASEADFVGFGEAYFSMVDFGATKGWKRHTRMQMNLVVPVGRIVFVVHDTRDGSPTQGDFLRVSLSPDDPTTYQRLSIAPGLWVGFHGAGQEANLLMNVASIAHDPQEAESLPLASFTTRYFQGWS